MIRLFGGIILLCAFIWLVVALYRRRIVFKKNADLEQARIEKEALDLAAKEATQRRENERRQEEVGL